MNTYALNSTARLTPGMNAATARVMNDPELTEAMAELMAYPETEIYAAIQEYNREEGMQGNMNAIPLIGGLLSAIPKVVKGGVNLVKNISSKIKEKRAAEGKPPIIQSIAQSIFKKKAASTPAAPPPRPSLSPFAQAAIGRSGFMPGGGGVQPPFAPQMGPMTQQQAAAAGSTGTGTGFDFKKNLPLILGIGAGVYLLTRKKR